MPRPAFAFYSSGDLSYNRQTEGTTALLSATRPMRKFRAELAAASSYSLTKQRGIR